MKHNINYLDMRKELEKDSATEYHELFFDTDHHWRPQTGLMATRALVTYINSKFSYNLPLSALEQESFSEEIYKNYFLGSYGKKLTAAKVKLDDISLLYPSFKTDLTLEVPTLDLETSGNFSIIYDYQQMSAQYYDANPYGAYLYGGATGIKLHNNLAENSVKVLVIKDSYASVMVPFLALTVSQVDLLDLREGEFDGSVRSYIDKEKPDIVLVSYYVDNVGWDQMFDFR